MLKQMGVEKYEEQADAFRLAPLLIHDIHSRSAQAGRRQQRRDLV